MHYYTFIPGGSKVVITADEGLRGSKKISLKSTVDKALETCDVVESVLVYQRTGAEIQMQYGRDSYLEEVLLLLLVQLLKIINNTFRFM